MVYAASFHRLVLTGTLYGDTWSTSLSIVPNFLTTWVGMVPVSQASCDTVAGIVGTWFGANTPTGPGFISSCKLVSVKLNRIDVNGHYEDQAAREYVFPTPVPGQNSGLVAPQLTTVVTLATAVERGAGSKGRMYLPPNVSQQSVQSDGRITPAVAQAQAQSAKNLFTSLNDHYTAVGSVGVASDVGSGAFNHVTTVRVGRVIDTMRSRRSTLIEDYQDVPM